MTRQELQRMREWADAQIAAGQDATWIWYQYMKLREALDGIVAGMECVALQSEDAQPFGQHSESGPHLVVSNDGASHHKQAGLIASVLPPRRWAKIGI